MSGATGPSRSARLRRRFWIALDYGAAAFCAVLIFAVLFHASDGSRAQIGLLAPRDALLAVLAIGMAVPVAIRRRVPVRSVVIVLAGCLATLIIGGEITRGPFLPLALVLYLVASTCRRGIALAGLAGSLALLIAQGVVLHLSGQGSGNATAAALVLTIFWMVGYLVQQRRTHMAHVRDRAATDAVTRERLRIARELHDVVAHSMTVVTVQAGFGEYVFDSQPDEARAALGAIQAVSREALGEMQRMLCVLRQTDGDIAADAEQAEAELTGHGPAVTPAGVTGTATAGVTGTATAGGTGTATAGTGPAATGTGPGPGTDGTAGRPRAARMRPAAPLAPAPGLANLDRLVERTAGAGVTVTVERIGQPRGLPASLDLSAFRIVQESLTNVVKHSGADRCHVVLEYSADSLLIEVTDPGAGVPSGVGAPARVPAAASVPAGTVPPGTVPPGTVPPGTVPPGTVPPGTVPPGTVPAGAGTPAGAGPAVTSGPPRAGAAVRPLVRIGSGPDRAGHGIIGMRERVSLCGGELHAMPRPDGGFVVRARLPLSAGRP